MTAAVLVVLALLCLLGAVMGFRDAPNAVALPVRHRALTPQIALLMAAILNAAGVVLGAATVSGLAAGAALLSGHGGPAALASTGIAALLAAAWGVVLWWRRVPGSTTHALLSAVLGTHLAAHLRLGVDLDDAVVELVRWGVLASLLLSPVLAWAVTRVCTAPVVRIATTGTTVNVQRRARIALAVAGGATAVGHGVQTGQRLAVLWAGALLAAGRPLDPGLTAAAVALFAVVVGLGTLGGAWRIAWTLTERLVVLDPLRAAVAAVVPALLLFVGSLVLHLPLSSTHTLTASIVGAGQTHSYASVRWTRVARVAAWWLVTPLVCGGGAFLVYEALAGLLPA